MAYPEDWAHRFQPLPGYVLVEREESPEATSSGLIIPPRLREAVKSPIARVVRSGDPRAQPGDFVLVAEGVGRRIAFGDFKPIVYYLVTYDQLRLRFARVEPHLVCDDPVVAEGEAGLWRNVWREVTQDESIHRVHLPEDILLAREDVVDQGLATAIGDQRGQP
jgi:co-chaperonin GroES (HSP10)